MDSRPRRCSHSRSSPSCAEDGHDPGHFAASALYAYAFLFPEEERGPLDPLDPRSRIAADLYNRALASAFQREPGGGVVMRSGGLDLPFGHFTAQLGEAPDLGGYALESVHPVADLEVKGFRNRYRRPGIGALAGRQAVEPTSGERERSRLPIDSSTHPAS